MDDAPTTNAYFQRVARDRFQPLAACAGAWNTAELHVSPVNGLLLHELERWLAEHSPADRPITRISLDYLGVIDFTECELEYDVVRGGRAVELVEAVLSQHGRPALRARVWRVAENDTAQVAGGERAALAPVEQAAPFDLTATWPGAYIESIELRVLEGPAPGRTTGWLTTPLAIVEGEPVSDLARLVLLTDTVNGIAVRTPPQEWQFPNVDLTIHLFRQPRGPWTGCDTTVMFGARGHGLTSADLFDEHGHVGRAEQALLVRRR